MTNEEAVKLLQATRLMLMDGANQPISDLYYALDLAIEALEQTEQTDCTGCEYINAYDTEFPCVNCIRRLKDYYTTEQTEREGE